ncbi:hypothetical protein [Streptomyces fumanus]|uniref:hypothetical protein n=1 Tax=Streptomyces fumanus TaxID=67302 RepID=UPI0033CCC2EA
MTEPCLPAASEEVDDSERPHSKRASYTRGRDARRAGLYPYYPSLDAREAGVARMTGGREVVMCGSNDSLGLSTDPRVAAAAAEATARYDAGCTGSRPLNGNLDLHDRLKREPADFFGEPAALVPTTGYQANLGAVAGLCGPGDLIRIDQQARASLIDAARLGRTDAVPLTTRLEPADRTGVYVNAVLPPAASPRPRTSCTAVRAREQLDPAVAAFAAVRERVPGLPVATAG